MFSAKNVDSLSTIELGEIIRDMGFRIFEEELATLLSEADEDGSGDIEMEEFCQLCSTFLVEDPHMDKDASR